jgi:hypothetical protein
MPWHGAIVAALVLASMKVVGRLFQTIAMLMAMAMLLAAAPVVADEVSAAPTIENVEVGIGGEYKVGHWTPVVVVLAVPADCHARLVLTTADGEGLSTRFADPEFIPLTAGTVRLERYLQFGHAKAGLTVELEVRDGPTVQRTFAARDLPPARTSTSELILVVGRDLGLQEALAHRSYQLQREVHVIPATPLEALPAHPLGYAAVDLVTLSTTDLDWQRVPEAQRNALRDWILLGGRAVISCGHQGEALFGAGQPLADLAPGTSERVAPLRRTAALETYAGSAQRLESVRDARVEIALFSNVRGHIEVSEGSAATELQPLIMHYPVGFGQVSLIAMDLDQPPLAPWAGRAALLARVLGFHQAGETGKGQGDVQSKLPAQLGYHDLAGQLRMALDQFSGVTLVAFSWVAGLIAFYILLIGPGDYFFLRFGLRRMQATWVTLGLLGIGFIALAWWLNTRLKSDRPLVNQAEIVDVDLASGVRRGISWTHVYSPRTEAYNLTPQVSSPGKSDSAETAPSQLRSLATAIGWEGLPGDGLGGLDGRPAPRLFDSPYGLQLQLSAATTARATDVPIQAAATKGFVTQWWRQGDALPNIQLQPTQDGLLRGEFVYPLDVPLIDSGIMYGNWLYRLPSPLKPGQKVTLETLPTPRNLMWQLTQKRVVDAKDVVTPWNPRSADIARILEVMMFHQAAGGDNYTGLTQRFYSRLDLSDHLRTGRAILVGQASQRAIDWGDAGLDEDSFEPSSTVVRVVIPIAPLKSP